MPTTRKRVSSKRPKRDKWRELLTSLPGYDPYRGSEGCWFDADAAQLALDFFPECIRHVEGELAGDSFRLERWQCAFIANLFGWKRKDSSGREVRRFRKSLLYVPRKNGKTPFAAAISLLVFFCDDERGQQNYMAAAEREQAGFLFRQARGMVETEPALDKQCHIYGGTAPAGQSKSIVKNNDISYLKVISADAITKHGQNSHLIVIDELHAQPNRELYDVLSTSLASRNRKQPLFIMITTADFMRESICNETYEYACKVRDGLIDDPAFLPCIYEALPGDDWKSEAVWAKANPNLGVSVSIDYLRAECKVAQETPAYENTFKRLHLNMRTEQDVRWLPLDQWDACAGCDAERFRVVEMGLLAGRDCFLGLDLANTNDVASLYAVFPPATEGEAWKVWPYYWSHEEACLKRERSNRAKFMGWVNQGHMIMTPGSVIDYSFIRQTVLDINRRYRVIKLAFDPWNAEQLAVELGLEGIECVKFQQSMTNYNEPCKKLEELLANRKLAHGGHPVTRWMVSNVTARYDGRGYLMPCRKASTEKIDGVMALLMGLGVAIVEEENLLSTRSPITIIGLGNSPPAEPTPEAKPDEEARYSQKATSDPLAWFGKDISDDDD